MAGLIAFMLIQGENDYEQGRQDALEGREHVGGSMMSLGSRYDEGYEDGLYERGDDEPLDYDV